MFGVKKKKEEPTLLHKISKLFLLADSHNMFAEDLERIHRMWHVTRGAVQAGAATTFSAEDLERINKLYAKHFG